MCTAQGWFAVSNTVRTIIQGTGKRLSQRMLLCLAHRVGWTLLFPGLAELACQAQARLFQREWQPCTNTRSGRQVQGL
jgi:hypothetical protein